MSGYSRADLGLHGTLCSSYLAATEGAVYVACSTHCFSKYPLEHALHIIAELEFSKFDVAIDERGRHLRPSEVVADVSRAAQRLRIGPGFVPGAFDVHLEATDEKTYHQQLQAIYRLARLSAVPVVTLAAAPAGSSLDAEVQRLTKLVRLAEVEGIMLALATHRGTLTEDPDTTVELCQRVAGLCLTFDPSHYIAGPHADKNLDALFPYVRHVHLRDTGRGPNQFQVRVGQGEVEYGRIVAQLARYRYDRLLTVHFLDIPDSGFAMEPEVRKLKFLLESLV